MQWFSQQQRSVIMNEPLMLKTDQTPTPSESWKRANILRSLLGLSLIKGQKARIALEVQHIVAIDNARQRR
jgi:hypothetical protein